MSSDEIRKLFESLPPPPKFDRVAVSDLRPFANVPYGEPSDPLWRLLGVPVIRDESVEVGVIELRKGDEVIERVLLLELRA